MAPLAQAVTSIQLSASGEAVSTSHASAELETALPLESDAPTEVQASTACGSGGSTLVQFVVVRRDLLKTMEWPVGSVIAQACHACTAVIWVHRDDGDVQSYLSDMPHMHKVVKECKGEAQLRALAQKLEDGGIVHHLWIEQPENIPTALALKPYPRDVVAPLLKKYQLFK